MSEIEAVETLVRSLRGDTGQLGICGRATREVEKRFGYPKVEGFYSGADSSGRRVWIPHAWNLLPSGDILDPTSDQFGFQMVRVVPRAEAGAYQPFTADQRRAREEFREENMGREPGPEDWAFLATKMGSSLSLEAIISVAEETMVRGRLTGRTWHIPASRLSVYPEGVWDPKFKADTKECREFLAKVLKGGGLESEHADSIRVIQSTYGMEGAIASTDGMGSITVKHNDVDTLTLLHECAHIINRTREGEGHDQRFVQVAGDLYRRYISAEAAEQFLKVVGMSLDPGQHRGGLEVEAAEDHDTDVMICLRPSEALLKVYADMDECTEPLEDLHITLYYLGEIEEDCGGEMGRERLYRGLYDFVLHAGYRGLTGKVNGFGQFLNEDANSLIALWDIPGIAEFRTSIMMYCKTHGFWPRQDDHGFTPHMSLAHSDEPFEKFPALPDDNPEKEVFGSIWLVWGEEWQEVPLL